MVLFHERFAVSSIRVLAQIAKEIPRNHHTLTRNVVGKVINNMMGRNMVEKTSCALAEDT
jgi:hypothetical protein